jgi:hypothetical protein
MGDGLMTPAGKALSSLREVRARKQLQQIVNGKQIEQERAAAIIKYLEDHKDLVAPYPTPVEKAVLARMLFEELANSEDSKAVRLVLKSGHFTPAFAKKHFKDMLAYAQELTGEQGLANSPLVEALAGSGDKTIIPVFEKWLPEASDGRTKAYLESKLKALRATP